MAELLSEIINRAKSFKIFKWHYHPEPELNPYTLSSQGYECTELNTL